MNQLKNIQLLFQNESANTFGSPARQCLPFFTIHKKINKLSSSEQTNDSQLLQNKRGVKKMKKVQEIGHGYIEVQFYQMREYNIINKSRKKMKNFETVLQKLIKTAECHISEKRYSWAMVYLSDALKDLELIQGSMQDQEESVKWMAKMKISCCKYLSLCYLKLGNYGDCISQCNQVLTYEPNSSQILCQIGLCYLNMYNLRQAETYFKKAYILDPDRQQTMKGLERIQHLRKEPEKNSLKRKDSRGKSWAKFVFLWPLIFILFIWRLFSPSKKSLHSD